MQFLRKLFDTNERDVQRYRKIADQVTALEPKMKALSDDDLRAQTDILKEKVKIALDGECDRLGKPWEDLTREEKRRTTDAALDPLVVDAFAVAREAAVRTLGMRPFDVQLIGGMVLHDGRIAEMKTGEGKTLTATLPLYLNALTGRGAHLVTVNDYLSKVGAVAMGPMYHFLGLSVGIIQGQSAETGDIGGTFIFDPEYRHPDPRYDNARPVTNRRDAYLCDITYGTNNEFGFDYLRDNLLIPGQDLAQPELIFAIVDEVDSILIDEARTPLIISGQAEASSEMYNRMDRIIRQLKEERDYTIEEKQKTAVFTDEGQRRVELALGIENLTDSANVSSMQHANAALRAHAVYKKDIDYLVKEGEDGKLQVVIIDEFTGRLMFGRRWSDGLHQAVEAKEGVKIENESRTLATITYQNLFRLYPKLAGMTGTAKTEEDEFRKIYALDCIAVPTNKPMVRKDHADIIFKTSEAKLRGIAREILRAHAVLQPILVGTRSVEMSERVSDRLRFDRLEMLALTDLLRDRLEAAKLDKAPYTKISDLINQPLTQLTTGLLAEATRTLGLASSMRDDGNLAALAKQMGLAKETIPILQEAMTHGVPHNVLNAKFHEKEALIISEAGRKGTVTIATNMAGRGVDILLGGSLVYDSGEGDGETTDETLGFRRGGHPIAGLTPVGARGSEEHERKSNEVRSLGGLYVIGTERHKSRRIDNQLRGRSGRQGDPGASRFFCSLQDELWRNFGDRSNNPLMAGWAEDQAIDSALLSKMIERAQKKVEMHFFDMRKHTLDYDDVMNVQREKIYGERRRILLGADLRDTIVDHLVESVEADLAVYASENVDDPAEWDLDGLYTSLNKLFPLQNYAKPEDLHGKKHDDLKEFLTAQIVKNYEDKEQHFKEILGEDAGESELRGFERRMMLQALDRHWMAHLTDMEYLREGIGWRGMSGIDPLVLYKKEAYDMFQEMLASMEEEVGRIISFVQISVEGQAPPQQQRERPTSEDGEDADGEEPAPAATAAAAGSSGPPGMGRADRRRMMKAKGRR